MVRDGIDRITSEKIATQVVGLRIGQGRGRFLEVTFRLGAGEDADWPMTGSQSPARRAGPPTTAGASELWPAALRRAPPLSLRGTRPLVGGNGIHASCCAPRLRVALHRTVPTKPRQALNPENAVELVDLVLQAGRLEPLRFDFMPGPVEIGIAKAYPRRPAPRCRRRPASRRCPRSEAPSRVRRRRSPD